MMISFGAMIIVIRSPLATAPHRMLRLIQMMIQMKRQMIQKTVDRTTLFLSSLH